MARRNLLYEKCTKHFLKLTVDFHEVESRKELKFVCKNYTQLLTHNFLYKITRGKKWINFQHFRLKTHCKKSKNRFSSLVSKSYDSTIGWEK